MNIQFLSFIKRETTRPLHKIIIIAILSGISNAVLLAIINAAAKVASFDNLNFRFLLMFAIVLAIYIISQSYILHSSTTLLEEILAKIRARLSDKIRKSHLLHLEQLGRSEIFNRLTQETMVISNAAPLLILIIQSAIMLVFLGIYIATLSKVAFILVLVLLSSAVYYYLYNHKKIQLMLQEANQSELNFFDSLRDILDGMKENKLNNQRSLGLSAFNVKITNTLKNIKIKTGFNYANNYIIFGQSFYNFLLGVIIFLLPRLSPTFTDVLTQLTASILFMIGPVGTFVGSMQTFDQASFSVSNIYKLEEALEKISEIYEDSPSYEKNLQQITQFQKIHLKNVLFSYKDAQGNPAFTIGPYNFNISSGETLFLVGGNGSGKTTLLKILCMLYYPDQGEIWLDHQQVKPTNVLDYRQLFSAVFSDFHLSNRLHGMENVNPHQVEELLKTMELDQKTEFLGDHFSTIELSTGQRKRLALLISLLEDKPIYIFDEWAADQDPEFRKYFYEVILKELKAKGKTIIAASHDDRFFRFADRVIKLDYGKISQDFGDSLKRGRK